MDFNFPHKEGTGIAKMIPHGSSECIDLITNLLMYNPEDRMSARQALKHPYFREMYVKDKARSKDASSSNEKSSRNKDGRSGKDGRSRSNRQSGQRDNAGNAQAKKATSRTSPRAAQSEKIPRDPKRDKAEGDQAQNQRTTEKAAEKRRRDQLKITAESCHQAKSSSNHGSSYVSSKSGKSKHNYRRYGGKAKDSMQGCLQSNVNSNNHSNSNNHRIRIPRIRCMALSTIQSTRKNSAIWRLIIDQNSHITTTRKVLNTEAMGITVGISTNKEVVHSTMEEDTMLEIHNMAIHPTANTLAGKEVVVIDITVVNTATMGPATISMAGRTLLCLGKTVPVSLYWINHWQKWNQSQTIVTTRNMDTTTN